MTLIYSSDMDWYDFNLDINDGGIYTAITENGTCHVIDLDKRVRRRVRLNEPMGDLYDIYLFAIPVSTPCGLIMYEALYIYWQTTSVLGLWEGDVIKTARKAYPTLSKEINMKFHPSEPCGARYCEKKKKEAAV